MTVEDEDIRCQVTGTASELSVATPNSWPSAEGSGDYNDTMMAIKSLKHRCVEQPNRNAS